ncbi:MAG: hypothetical protein ACD_21C00166G0001 [uncultured bacterium]|nr:MAG: hypothetical protein ACD_21C00166G0001 [uncultured bacterium]
MAPDGVARAVVLAAGSPQENKASLINPLPLTLVYGNRVARPAYNLNPHRWRIGKYLSEPAPVYKEPPNFPPSQPPENITQTETVPAAYVSKPSYTCFALPHPVASDPIVLHEITNPGSGYQMLLSPQGNYIVSIPPKLENSPVYASLILFYIPNNTKLVLLSEVNPPYGQHAKFSFSHNENWLACSNVRPHIPPASIVLYHLPDGSPGPVLTAKNMPKNYCFSCFNFSKDDAWLAAGYYNFVSLWRIPEGRLEKTLLHEQLTDDSRLYSHTALLKTNYTGNIDMVKDVIFSPSNDYLVSSVKLPLAKLGQTIRLWRVLDWTLEAALTGDISAETWSLSFSHQGKWLACVSKDYIEHTIRLWHMPDKTPVPFIHAGDQQSVSFMNQRDWLLVINENTTRPVPTVYDISAGRLLCFLLCYPFVFSRAVEQQNHCKKHSNYISQHAIFLPMQNCFLLATGAAIGMWHIGNIDQQYFLGQLTLTSFDTSFFSQRKRSRSLEKKQNDESDDDSEISLTDNCNQATFFSQNTPKKTRENILHINGFVLQNVEGNGNCFYLAVIEQLRLVNHAFLATIPQNTSPEDSLRLRVQGQNFRDREWAGEAEILTLVRNLDCVIAVYDTRYPANGFLCYNNAGYSNQRIDVAGRTVIRLGYTGNHYLSVVSHPVLTAGAILEAFDSRQDYNDSPTI